MRKHIITKLRVNTLFNIDLRGKVDDSVYSASDSGELKLTSVAKD